MSLGALATAATAKEIAAHVVRWLANLGRARTSRQRESLRAVNRVTALMRKTTAYRRGHSAGRQNFDTEAILAEQWSLLGHELQELGLMSLAKRCDVMGRYWADPATLSPEFLDQADISFQSVERLAAELAAKIQLDGVPARPTRRPRARRPPT